MHAYRDEKSIAFMWAVTPTSTLANPGFSCAGCWRGFTLIELLTTLVVLAVSLALAAPALSSFVRGNQLRASQSELVSSLMLARSEAARVGLPARVEALQPVASGGFTQGWRVWVDSDGDGTFDAGESLREVPKRTGGVTITTSVRTVVFNASGFLEPVTPVSFDVKGVVSDDSTQRYCVQLTPVGLADVSDLAKVADLPCVVVP